MAKVKKGNMTEGKRRFYIDVSGMSVDQITDTMTSVVEGTQKGLAPEEAAGQPKAPQTSEGSLSVEETKKILGSEE
jgi:hypothetical protein